MAVVTITLAGVDITPVVLFGSAIFDSQVNGKPGICRFRIRDEDGTATYVVGSELLVEIDGEPVWAGFATVIKRVYIFPALNLSTFGDDRFFDVEGVDLNILFQRRIVFNQDDPADIFGTLFPVNTPDTTAITDLLANFLDLSGDSLDTTSDVHNVGDITINQEGRAWQGSDRWGDAMTSIARIPGAIFYIRPDRTLAYVDDDTADAPIALSDVVSEFYKTYREMEILVDGTGLANDVLAWGIGYGSQQQIFQRVTDASSVSEHGLWQDSRAYAGVFKQDTLDANVNSIVYGSPMNLRGAKDDKLAVMLTTFAPGLLPGMKVDFQSQIFGISVTLPVRKMTLRFPAPDTPKYELVLSQEIDTPFDIIDNLFFNWRIPPIPPIPPIGDPPPPPPAPISCGITDTYHRADTDYSDNSLTVADCGRSYESFQQKILGLRGQSIGPFDPGTTASGISWSLPGSWPVPFHGTIVLVAADNTPGFQADTDGTYEYPTGFAWHNSPQPKAYFDGTGPFGPRAVLPTGLSAGSSPVPSGSYMTIGPSAVGGGLVFTEELPMTIIGHIDIEETADPNGLTLDDYIHLRFGLQLQNPILGDFEHTIEVIPHGSVPSGDPAKLVGSPFVAGTGDVDFPAGYWQTNGGADWSVTFEALGTPIPDPPNPDYTSQMTVTVGPCTVSLYEREGTRLRGIFAIGNTSLYDDAGSVTYATAYIPDGVTFNDLLIDEPLSWTWRVNGVGLDGDLNEQALQYEFAYVGYGGQWPGFPTSIDTGLEAWADGYSFFVPGLIGPYIAVKITQIGSPGSYSVAWASMTGLTLPAIPLVTMDQFGASLSIGGTTTTALAADGVEYGTGDAAPLALLTRLTSDLTQFAGAGQGTYFAYADLNVQGVNACTEGVINTGVNWLSTWFTADGTQDTFTLPGPFYRGSAAVYVAGFRQRQVVDYIEDPAAGQIIFSTPPAAGKVVVVSYYPASSP